MDTSPEMARKLEAMYREQLERNFQGTFKFDPILVEPTLDQYGEDTFHVTVVYDGDEYLLDAGKLNEITVKVWGQLRAMGIDKIPIESHVYKEEYDLGDELLGLDEWEEDFD